MARVTIEDCIEKIPNPYELVLVAANRARTIALGAPTTVDTNRDKPTVVALREIAQQTLSVDDLRQALIRSLQHNLEADEADASAAPLLPSQDHARIGGNEVDASVQELTEDQLLEAMRGVLPPDTSIPERERISGSEPERAEEAEAASAADRQRG